MGRQNRKIGALTLRPFVRDGRPTGQWVVDIPAEWSGTEKRQRRVFEDYPAATAGARELWDIARAEGRVRPTREERNGTTIASIFALWFAYEEDKVAAQKKSPGSLERDSYLLQALQHRLGETPLARLTDRHVLRYQAARLGDGRKPRTVNDETSLLFQVLRWAKNRGFTDQFPTVAKIPEPAPDPTVVEPHEVAALLVHLKEPVRTLVQLLATTGCRWSEAAQLEWVDVDELNGEIRIRAYEGRSLKTVQSNRTVPLPDETVQALRALPKKNRFVFPGRKPHSPITSIKKSLKTASEKAGLKRRNAPFYVTPQMLRSSYATWMATSGVAEHILQDLIGHRRGSRVTKRHYLARRPDEMRSAVKRLFGGDQ